MKWQDEPPTEHCEDCQYLRHWVKKSTLTAYVEDWWKCFHPNPQIEEGDGYCHSKPTPFYTGGKT